jgi:hypothetical protein
MIFEANSVLQVPGSYININWYFDEFKSRSFSDNGINEIIFDQTSNTKGKTEFKIQNGIVMEFDIVINHRGLSPENLYNVILHELGHVYLLGHSEYDDSIMGYVLDMLSNGQIQKTDKLVLTYDDCIGLYNVLIRDISIVEYTYYTHLNHIKNVYCERMPRNYILKDDIKIRNLNNKPFNQQQHSFNKNTLYERGPNYTPFIYKSDTDVDVDKPIKTRPLFNKNKPPRHVSKNKHSNNAPIINKPFINPEYFINFP